MTYDPFTDRLSDYIDAELSSEEKSELDAHLAKCDECSKIMSELRALRRDASRLGPIDPPEEVWTAISARLRAGEAPAQSSIFYTALAAAAALVLGVSLWIALTPTEPPAQDPQVLADMVTEELRAAESHYENAIVGLEQIIAQNEGSLPPELNQTITDNLDLIEQAIDESRTAIETNPESSVAQDSLLEAFRRKVNLLQNTILLINEVRKGEGESALDLIEEMRESDDPSNPI